ncbi:hypothetical protein Q5M85_20665 [Paraclostridium bifermentans]|nr:hypothetical protein [Paraclostridium bifermentans]
MCNYRSDYNGSRYALGYFATSVIWVHAMIILISIGTGFFKGNLNALVGELYR